MPPIQPIATGSRQVDVKSPTMLVGPVQLQRIIQIIPGASGKSISAYNTNAYGTGSTPEYTGDAAATAGTVTLLDMPFTVGCYIVPAANQTVSVTFSPNTVSF